MNDNTFWICFWVIVAIYYSFNTFDAHRTEITIKKLEVQRLETLESLTKDALEKIKDN